MLVNEFDKNFRLIFNTLLIQDGLYSFEELSGNDRFLLSSNGKLNDCTTGMEGFDDFIFEVAGEYESAVARKLLCKRPK